jgi:transcriptional regulator with XRE-family HTH domain
MSLRNEIAAAIRVIRRLKGLGYEELAEASSRANLGLLERGQTNITVDKLAKLAGALDFDPVALLAICIALAQGEAPRKALDRAMRQLEAFEALGGLEAIEQQFNGDSLVLHPRGKPTNKQNDADVLRLKASGMSQAEVAKALGLAKSTVWRYWQK